MDLSEQAYQAGDIVYVIYRNPHTYTAANVQQAAVVHHPDQPGELALFLYETYYPLDQQIAIYPSEVAAEQDFARYFGAIE
ncbi:transcriptional regulator SplA domain-containing protein [Bacillus sp. FJAT-42315]|uniref:transcriptional regulator SplA domain-containing protein n=1 Tax=Bacillus sp. FJAT-42315 TaxID=2014077 RepID=UPI000C233F87|nr:transcriptional regulator SplA domain-containing protein [Bacillus sp. FJAT-42315]